MAFNCMMDEKCPQHNDIEKAAARVGGKCRSRTNRLVK